MPHCQPCKLIYSQSFCPFREQSLQQCTDCYTAEAVLMFMNLQWYGHEHDILLEQTQICNAIWCKKLSWFIYFFLTTTHSKLKIRSGCIKHDCLDASVPWCLSAVLKDEITHKSKCHLSLACCVHMVTVLFQLDNLSNVEKMRNMF